MGLFRLLFIECFVNLVMKIIEMIKEKSKFGIGLVVLYCLLVVWTVYEMNTCNGMFCDLIIIIPVLPWTYFLEFIGFLPDNMIIWGVLVFANALILYLVGYFIQKKFANDYK